jgi:hypothetical protein
MNRLDQYYSNVLELVSSFSKISFFDEPFHAQFFDETRWWPRAPHLQLVSGLLPALVSYGMSGGCPLCDRNFQIASYGRQQHQTRKEWKA